LWLDSEKKVEQEGKYHEGVNHRVT
jgi:hypothetical protein